LETSLEFKIFTCHRYLSNFKVFFITEKQYLYELS